MKETIAKLTAKVTTKISAATSNPDQLHELVSWLNQSFMLCVQRTRFLRLVDSFSFFQEQVERLVDQLLCSSFKLKIRITRHVPKLIKPARACAFKRQNLDQEINNVGG